MFVADELSAYVFVKNRRKIVPSLVAITEETNTKGNDVLWGLWKNMIKTTLNASLQNGTQLEFNKFLDGVNAMVLGGFITEDEMSSRLERALQQE